MLRPIADRVVILPDEGNALASSLYLFQRIGQIIASDEQIGTIGTVVAVGPGKPNKRGKIIPLEVKPGDRVTLGQFIFPEYHEDGKTYLVAQEADITGIVSTSDIH